MNLNPYARISVRRKVERQLLNSAMAAGSGDFYTAITKAREAIEAAEKELNRGQLVNERYQEVVNARVARAARRMGPA